MLVCWHAGLKAFFTTPQLSVKDKVANSLALGTSPIVRALIDPEGGMRDIRGLDNVSFADWFKSHGGSQGSIDRMWDPIGARLSWCHLSACAHTRLVLIAVLSPRTAPELAGTWAALYITSTVAVPCAAVTACFAQHCCRRSLVPAADPISIRMSAAYALGFLDCKDISARCMLTIFQFFATKTDASKLRMLSGSPKERLLQPILDYIEARGGRLHIRWGCR